MTKAIPTIQKFMTMAPHSIGIEQTLATADRMMSDHHIRHLPVLHGGTLKGIVTDRDLRLLSSIATVDFTTAKVEDAMSSEVYAVSPETPLDEVVGTMAEHKYGSAVVLANHKVVGIFTTVDACRSLAELLRTRLGGRREHDVATTSPPSPPGEGVGG